MTKRIERGLAGYQIDGELKLAYQSRKSAPNDLGVKLVEELRNVDNWGEARYQVRDIFAFAESKPMSELSQVRAEIRRHFPSIMMRSGARDMYELMEPFQGSLQPYLEGSLSYLAQAKGFLADSKFCDWAYVANLDDGQFEIFRGNQTEPDGSLSFEQKGGVNRMGYYPCRMVRSYDLGAIPDVERFLSDLGHSESTPESSPN